MDAFHLPNGDYHVQKGIAVPSLRTMVLEVLKPSEHEIMSLL